MTYVRKDAARLSDREWSTLIDAINQLHGAQAKAPAYRLFVKVHTDGMTTAEGMTWGVHTMRNMGTVGRNFLAWHRQFLLQFEQRLRQVHGGIAIPYWDWLRNPQPPPSLSKPALLRSWSVSRTGGDMNQMPTRRLVQAVLARTAFTGFQRDLEAAHGGVHNAVGGDMMTAHSPADPIFYLHHANIDRLWAQWQATQAKAGNAQAKPPNAGETLLPSGLFGIKVSSLLDVAKLGYSYG